MASTIKVQDIVNSARAYPNLEPILGASGWTQEPALTIANDVMQKFLAQNLDWKFNRGYVPPFITVSLQQDYVTNVTNLSWLESASRLDINNTAQPKPFPSMETVRDLGFSAYQGQPFNMSWLPNNLAVMGIWQRQTAYLGGYGVAQTPVSPIQQFIDVNGNILFINSAALGLNPSSPGYAGTPIAIPGTPYGISGNVQPFAAPSSPAGTTVVDGTVTWTVADPNGVAMRLAPIPPYSGLCWLIYSIYQKKPPILTSLQNTLAPVPDEYSYLFRQGFMAMCYEHADSKNSSEAYQKWEEALMIALRSGDREREDATIYPSESIMGGGPYSYGTPIGPAWPFNYTG